MSHVIGADSEVGGLRAVLLHRPGPELRRVTPRTRERLAFDGLPWVSRAQQEHDVLAQVLRDRGVEVLYLTELLQDVLQYATARAEAIRSVLAGETLGAELRGQVRAFLDTLAPRVLAGVLIGGLAAAEFRSGRGVVYQLLDPHEFVIEPLPNLVFSRDSSVWIGGQAVLAGLGGPRRREADLVAVVYGHHPRFAGIRPPYRPHGEPLFGGDLLQLAAGVIAVGVGVRTTPAAVERLAAHLLGESLAHTVIAVPLNQRLAGGTAGSTAGWGAAGRLDTLCTVVAPGAVIMAPALAFTLAAHSITQRDGELRVSRPQPFPGAAAQAMGIDRLKIIDTGIEPRPGTGDEWDDAANALAVGERTVLCSERSAATIARLAAEGIEVIGVPTGELGGRNGGPRCLCVPIARLPVAATAEPEVAELMLADLDSPSWPDRTISDPAGELDELAPSG